jgi:acyl-CoA synthetase
LRHLFTLGLPRFEMPEFLLQLDRMPLTASGKIVKRELIKGVAEGRLAPLPVRFPGAPPGKD